MKFKREDGGFDIGRFQAAARIFITAQDIIVDNASYPTREIAENSHLFRTLGLGYANLGSLIMSYGLPYDSDEGRALAGAVTAILTGHAYEQSARIASVLGPFPGYRDARCAHVAQPLGPDNVASTLDVIQLHRQAVEDIHPSSEFAYLKDEARQTWSRALERGQESGYRNAQVTVLAPTGTIAFLMDCDTTGVEPDIALVKYKLLAGGGSLKIVNRGVADALRRLQYAEPEIAAIIAHVAKFDTIEDVQEKAGEGRPHPLRLEAGAPAGLRLRLQGLSRPAQHQLHGPPQDDGRHPALHQRRHFQDRQPAPQLHRGRHPGRLRPGLENGPQMRRHLPRRLQTLPAAQHPKNQRRRPPRPPPAASRNWKPRSANSRPKPASPSAAACPTPAPLSPINLKSPATKATSPSAFSRDGQPGELFITMAKEGSTIGGLMDSIGTLTSLALQYGVPLEALIKKFAHQRFEPSGFTKNPDIRNASSIIDYVFRWLGYQFVPGYPEAGAGTRAQTELPMPGLDAGGQKKNKPPGL